MLLFPNTALASTQIGSAQGAIRCANAGDFVQASSSGPSYAVPSGGSSITSWSFQAGAGDTGPAALEVWRPTAPPTYTLVGISPPATVIPYSLNTFPLAAPIAVQPGDLIGLQVDLPSTLTCVQPTQNSGDAIGSHFGGTPAVNGTAVMITAPLFQLNVAATLEVTITPPPPPPPTPTSADQCKHDGWQALTDSQGTPFKNQGDCVSFVATNGTNAASGPPA